MHNIDDPDRPTDAVDELLWEYTEACQRGQAPDLEAFLAAQPQEAAELRALIEMWNDLMANRRAGGDALDRLRRDAGEDRLRRVLPVLCPGCGYPVHQQLYEGDGSLPPGCMMTSEDLVGWAETIAEEAGPLPESTPEEQAEAEAMWQRFKQKVLDPERERRQRERET